MGRFWLIIGALQLITGWLFYQRTTVGQTHGLVWTFIRALPYAGLTQ